MQYRRCVTDRLFDALFFTADWWSQLAAAELWAKAARLLEAVDPAGARVAWGYAARSYGIHVEEHSAHSPASRWDYDYGPELSEAEDRRRALPDRDPSPALPEWARLLLERRFTDALGRVNARPEAGAERALLAVLALACRHADRKDDAERLEGWSK
jgi:hypothetical protein